MIKKGKWSWQLTNQIWKYELRVGKMRKQVKFTGRTAKVWLIEVLFKKTPQK
jgi:hypothetical protein